MKRDIKQLQNGKFDLLVIGSGIYGSCIAWDASLRGLSVALIDKGDFGQATSANSLKIIHGGFRYLQDGNPWLIRKMSRERMNWMRIAPHLVHPLPCLVPTYQKFARSKAAFTVALLMNDLLSYDRTQLSDSQKYLPRGKILSRTECLDQLPGIRDDGITGGALWYDAQTFSTERLLLSIVLSASRAGAVVANYVEATGFLTREKQVKGVHALDLQSGCALDISARIVLNCTGAWTDKTLGLSGMHLQSSFNLSTAINLVTRQIITDHAVGFLSRYSDTLSSGKEFSRMLFMVPWHCYSIIGTIHNFYSGNPEDFHISEEMIGKFIQEINHAYPGAELTREDVHYVHSGFLPLDYRHSSNARLKLLRESYIHDHEIEDGISGLVTIVGVKYTTARETAEKAVNLVVNKLGRKNSSSKTAKTQVHGGQIDDFNRFLSEANILLKDFSTETIEHLSFMYGTQHQDILALVREDPSLGQRISINSPIIRAEVAYAVRSEMALKLADVVFRRTDFATAGRLDEQGLQACAEVMAQELEWSHIEKEQALTETRNVYQSVGALTEDVIGVHA